MHATHGRVRVASTAGVPRVAALLRTAAVTLTVPMAARRFGLPSPTVVRAALTHARARACGSGHSMHIIHAAAPRPRAFWLYLRRACRQRGVGGPRARPSQRCRTDTGDLQCFHGGARVADLCVFPARSTQICVPLFLTLFLISIPCYYMWRKRRSYSKQARPHARSCARRQARSDDGRRLLCCFALPSRKAWRPAWLWQRSAVTALAHLCAASC
jgi:hypothetical protein